MSCILAKRFLLNLKIHQYYMTCVFAQKIKTLYNTLVEKISNLKLQEKQKKLTILSGWMVSNCIIWWRTNKNRVHRENCVNHTILPMWLVFYFVRNHIMQFETIPFCLGNCLGSCMSRNQFWFLLILRKKSVQNYLARKLELLNPQNRYLSHQGGIFLGYFFQAPN